MRSLAAALLPVAALALAGCGGGDNQPPFPELHPVKGVVKRDGRPVNGGGVRFVPDPDKGEFMVTGTVGADGTFTLATIRATDKRGEQKPGAAAASYKVTYTPGGGDQTGGFSPPVELTAPVIVNPGPNDLVIDLPKR